jgi:hypothetical protein
VRREELPHLLELLDRLGVAVLPVQLEPLAEGLVGQAVLVLDPGLLDELLDRAGRDQEVVPLGPGRLEGGQPDDLPLLVDRRAARVAGRDRRGHLDDRHAVGGLLQRRHVAVGDGRLQHRLVVEHADQVVGRARIADGVDLVLQLDARLVAEEEGRRVAGLGLEDRDVFAAGQADRGAERLDVVDQLLAVGQDDHAHLLVDPDRLADETGQLLALGGRQRGQVHLLLAGQLGEEVADDLRVRLVVPLLDEVDHVRVGDQVAVGRDEEAGAVAADEAPLGPSLSLIDVDEIAGHHAHHRRLGQDGEPLPGRGPVLAGATHAHGAGEREPRRQDCRHLFHVPPPYTSHQSTPIPSAPPAPWRDAV